MKKIKNCVSICDLFKINSQKYPDNAAIIDDYNNYKSTFRSLYEDIISISAFLQSFGIQKNNHIAQFSENCGKWMVVDQGILKSGAVNAVRGSKAPISELEYIYIHSDSIALVCDNLDLINSLSSFLKKNNCRFILYIGNKKFKPTYDNKFTDIPVISFEEAISIGKTLKYKDVFNHQYDLATIVYSSGTTGKPKGIMLSHGNLISQFFQIKPALDLKPLHTVLSILPIWHMYERMCEYYILGIGCKQYYTNIKNIKKDFIKYNPHYLISVPRIWESIYNGIESTLKTKLKLFQNIYKFSFNCSLKFKKQSRILNNLSIENQHPSFYQKTIALAKILPIMPINYISQCLIFRKIKKSLGNNFIKGVSGGGALARHIEDFYEALNIDILVGYGLTETSPVLTVRTDKNNKPYTAGPPLKDTKIIIAEPETFRPLNKGEKGIVLVKGPQVMRGYYKNTEETQKVFLKDGSFITGDLGWLTDDNLLVLTGRIKDIIVLSNGENIEPESLEQECLKNEFVKQIVLVGQDKAALGALIVPDMDMIRAWAIENKLSENDAKNSPKLRQYILSGLRKNIQNRPNYRSFERISDIRFVDEPFTPENGMMTFTAKIKKNEVFNKHHDLIESIYQ